MAAIVEHQFETVRSKLGLPVDSELLTGPNGFDGAAFAVAPKGIGLRELYDAYMADPTRDWSPTTRMAYQTTQRVVLAILGEDTPIGSITRGQCREMLDVLRMQPRNASKLFVGMHPRDIADRAREAGRTDFISPANINTYLNKLGGMFNWAVKEALLERNPAQGLKVPDPTHRRDKRLPFSVEQLRAIFAAPLYTGCRDDGHGYALSGPNRPRNARFWIPLISMFAGLRQNEVCQLDVADVRDVEGVPCFIVSERSDAQTTDKRLKTTSSERIVPIHSFLLELDILAFVETRRRTENPKLFSEIGLGATGYRSTTFSQWFRRFLSQAKAGSSRTCFHSFRHGFRDALREGHIDRDIALALGGWSTTGGSTSVSDAYGRGYRALTLKEAIDSVSYPGLDLLHLRK